MIEHKLRKNYKQFRWGPIDALFISMMLPANSIPQSAHAHGVVWPRGAVCSNGRQWMWLSDWESLLHFSKQAFTKHMNNAQRYTELHQYYSDTVKKLESSVVYAYQDAFTSMADAEFIAGAREWVTLINQFWAVAAVPELATWGGESIVTEELKRYSLNGAEFQEALRTLTAPMELSFFQKAEQERLWLFQEVHSTSARRSALIQGYIDRWYWLNNSYAQAKRLTTEEVEQELNETKIVDVQEKLRSIAKYEQNLIQNRRRLQEQHQLSDELITASETLGRCISWQDARKEVQWRNMDVLLTILKEVQRRWNNPISQTQWLTAEELLEYYNNPEKTELIADDRSKGCFVDIKKEGSVIYTGEEARKLLNEFWELQHSSLSLIGTVASTGHVEHLTGQVQCITSATQFHEFNAGSILVSAMTSPDYLPIMKKAIAIVTDEGGLTAHAAVVSRELGIPCIVGVKNATAVLKNGDTVTLDLKTGKIVQQ